MPNIVRRHKTEIEFYKKVLAAFIWSQGFTDRIKRLSLAEISFSQTVLSKEILIYKILPHAASKVSGNVKIVDAEFFVSCQAYITRHTKIEERETTAEIAKVDEEYLVWICERRIYRES